MFGLKIIVNQYLASTFGDDGAEAVKDAFGRVLDPAAPVTLTEAEIDDAFAHMKASHSVLMHGFLPITPPVKADDGSIISPGVMLVIKPALLPRYKAALDSKGPWIYRERK